MSGTAVAPAPPVPGAPQEERPGARRRVWPWVLVAMLLVGGVTAGLTVSWLNRELAHYADIDEDDPAAVAVRDAHKALNAAVGWDSWRPGYLDGRAAALRELSTRYSPSHPVHGSLVSAADAIDEAVALDDPGPARRAHGIIAGLERRFAHAYEASTRSS